MFGAAGARLHLVPLPGGNGFIYRGTNNDLRGAAVRADLLRVGRRPEVCITTPI
ncbi:MAG: hypothetical protein ACRDTD_23810 [Pseudonocardiaceae bacterium]